MSKTFRFMLSGIAREVTPIIRLDAPAAEREEVLLFSTPDSQQPFAEDRTFAWSKSLSSTFRYVPSASAGVVGMSPFAVPAGMTELTITAKRLATEGATSVADIELAVFLDGIESVILPARS